MRSIITANVYYPYMISRGAILSLYIYLKNQKSYQIINFNINISRSVHIPDKFQHYNMNEIHKLILAKSIFMINNKIYNISSECQPTNEFKEQEKALSSTSYNG